MSAPATNGAVDIVLEPARGGANGTSVDGKQ